MSESTALPHEIEHEEDSTIDTLIRWAGDNRGAIRELLFELAQAHAENAALKAARC